MDGVAAAWCLASPSLGEREVAEALLEVNRGHLHPGLVIIGDKGLAGVLVDQHVAQLGVRLLRPDRLGEPARVGNLGPVRQWVEAIFDTLKDQLSLERHGARTRPGVHARVAQRLLALAAAVWFNWQLGMQPTRSPVAYDH